jgi:hypothetical protein
MNQCINCQKETKNAKFCSRNCAASTNNKITPKRQKQNSCAKCGESIKSAWIYCSICTPGKLDYSTITLKDLEGVSCYVIQSRIRYHSRAVYKDSGKELKCLICGYSNHVHIAHIKPVKSFPKEASLQEVNSINNLVALCPNHHWEYDNNLIDL